MQFKEIKENRKRQKRYALVLFVVALITRLSILILFDHNRVPPDGTIYHRIAVNLVRGNGFSNQEQPPFEKFYFREPGYPFFLAGVYSLVNLAVPVQYIETDRMENHKLDSIHPEIVAAKTVQILLDSLGMVLLFFILLKISNLKIAFLSVLVTALFFNLAFHSILILRESLIVFLLLVLNYFYIEYVQSDRKPFRLMMMGTTIGLLILLFQVHAVIIPILFVLMIFKSKSLKTSVIHISLTALFAILVTLPHLLNVYMFYPDIRIVKTFGSSFTHELIKYDKAVTLLYLNQLISEEEAYQMRDWSKPSRIQFERSFNGYYTQKADEFKVRVSKVKNNTSNGFQRRIRSYLDKLRKSIFLTKLTYFSGSSLVKSYGFLILIPLVIFPVLIGCAGILGLLLTGRRVLVYLLPFISYLLLFWLLGSEYRRMIVLQPFLIFFGILLFDKVLTRLGIGWLNNDPAESA